MKYQPSTVLIDFILIGSYLFFLCFIHLFSVVSLVSSQVFLLNSDIQTLLTLPPKSRSKSCLSLPCTDQNKQTRWCSYVSTKVHARHFFFGEPPSVLIWHCLGTVYQSRRESYTECSAHTASFTTSKSENKERKSEVISPTSAINHQRVSFRLSRLSRYTFVKV